MIFSLFSAGLSGMSGLDPLTSTPCPPVQGPPCNRAHMEERAVVPDQLHMEAQVSGSVRSCPVCLYFPCMIKTSQNQVKHSLEVKTQSMKCNILRSSLTGDLCCIFLLLSLLKAKIYSKQFPHLSSFSGGGRDPLPR